MSERSGVDLAGRGHVVAHLGAARDEPGEHGQGLLPDRPFVLGHVGTLLGPRDPAPVVAALDRLLLARPEARDQIGLALLGPLDRRHRDAEALHDQLAPRLRDGSVVVRDERLSAAAARAAVAGAALGLVIEAPDPESPFFPAKLADLLAAGGPMLALSPRESVVADLVGPDSRRRVDPGDVRGITAALEAAWLAWRDGELDRYRPPAESRRAVADDVVAVALEGALEAAVRAGRG
jgi:hypothetical protein